MKLLNKIELNKFYIIENHYPYQKWIFFITEIDHESTDNYVIYYSGVSIFINTDDYNSEKYLEMSTDVTMEPIIMSNIDINDSELIEITKDKFIEYLNLFKNKREFDDVKYNEMDIENYRGTCYFENEVESPDYHAVIKNRILAINTDFLNPDIQDWKEDADFIESEKSYFDDDWNKTILSIEKMIS